MVTFARPREVVLHYDHRPGSDGKRPIVFANSLGTDLRIWDEVRRRLDPAIPVLALDKRGHGLSETRSTDIATLASDTADMMDRLGLTAALVCGVSVGGLVAETLAAGRPDLVAGLMLCTTGARIGSAEIRNPRIETVREQGVEAIAESVLERRFSPSWSAAHPVALAGWRETLVRTPAAGYAATCEAIRGADLTEATSALRVPMQCVAGSADGATPPALVRTLARMIPDASFACFENGGHRPCIEAPDRLAELLARFHGSLK